MTVLTGATLALVEDLDRRFLALADRWSPQRIRFGPTVSAAALERIDYFRSFPHVFSSPVSLRADEVSLAAFVDGDPVVDGELRLGDLAPVREVLSPAACYPLYDHLSGRVVDDSAHYTMVATCFRREAEYVALERQWAFTMREVVCVGSASAVSRFLSEARDAVDALREDLGLPAEWQAATDPFFRPSKNPKYLMQRIDPTKHELVYDGRLAIASVNLHHDHFGAAFDIATSARDTSGGSRTAHTGCVAFGVERWAAAIAHQHGPDPRAWPAVAP